MSSISEPKSFQVAALTCAALLRCPLTCTANAVLCRYLLWQRNGPSRVSWSIMCMSSGILLTVGFAPASPICPASSAPASPICIAAQHPVKTPQSCQNSLRKASLSHPTAILQAVHWCSHQRRALNELEVSISQCPSDPQLCNSKMPDANPHRPLQIPCPSPPYRPTSGTPQAHTIAGVFSGRS